MHSTRYLTWCCCCFGCVCLADVSTCYKHHSAGVILSDGMRIRLLASQRDMYISGFCLFLFLYVCRIVVVASVAVWFMLLLLLVGKARIPNSIPLTIDVHYFPLCRLPACFDWCMCPWGRTFIWRKTWVH